MNSEVFAGVSPAPGVRAFFENLPWLRRSVGFFGILLGGLGAAGAGLFSSMAALDFGNCMRGACGVPTVMLQMTIVIEVMVFLGPALAGYLLCLWTGFWGKPARWCAVLTMAFALGLLAATVGLPALMKELIERGLVFAA